MADTAPPPGAQGPVGIAAGAHKAWGDVRGAVNRSLQVSLRRSGRYRRQTLRLLSRKMKRA